MFGTGACERVHRVEHFLALGKSNCTTVKLVFGASKLGSVLDCRCTKYVCL